MKRGLIFKQLTGTLLFLCILFIGAGRLDYWQGWIYVGIGFFMFTLNYTVLKLDPALVEERSRPGEGVKRWDKRILGLSFLATIAMFIIAGLDSGRYHWSPGAHWSIYVTGIVLTVSGQLIFLVAQHQNRFFSSTVRIQSDRGHTVCEKGLYRYVRHPAYLGSLIQSLGFPLLFDSGWSILPAVIMMFLLIARTHMEDRTLRDELNGYTEYMQHTRYRMIPYIW